MSDQAGTGHRLDSLTSEFFPNLRDFGESALGDPHLSQERPKLTFGQAGGPEGDDDHDDHDDDDTGHHQQREELRPHPGATWGGEGTLRGGGPGSPRAFCHLLT